MKKPLLMAAEEERVMFADTSYRRSTTGSKGATSDWLVLETGGGKGKAKGGGGAVVKYEPPDQPESNIAVS